MKAVRPTAEPPDMLGSTRRWSRAAVMLAALLAGACGGKSAGSTGPSTTPPVTQNWSDEFDGPANALPDSAKWTYDLGGGGWGNQELETYTNQPQNVHLDGGGHLVIHVDRVGSSYTSARIKTQGLFTAQYGRVEARIRLPFGQGIWPAFWMLGGNFPGTPWPQCGEIDIMENVGREPSIIHGSVHGPGYSGGNSVTGLYTLPGGARFADDFHVFAIQWSPQTITFSVDGVAYKTVTPASLPPGASWVFDKPFFLILNVAVGGTWPGSPDATTQFPQEMIVDYVRVIAAS
jgi:beta-glucanase (GH16 family)